LADQQSTALVRMPVAGFLAWLIPGLGHIYLGHRARGLVCLVTITITFWTGVAIGGVRGTVDPKERQLWFIAQLCTAGNAVAAYALHEGVRPNPPGNSSVASAHWTSADVGVHYTGVAGLLNLLVIFDAIARADPSAPAPRRRREPKEGVP
jgi:TM2 domain-containing membrane protein YozV